jgi:hypothetical protein
VALPHTFPSNQWTPLGPAPLLSDATTASHTGGFQDYRAVSGRATSVVIDKNDSSGNTVYVGGTFGGLWKSVNAKATDPAAVTWTPLLDHTETLAVGSIALQPNNSSVILVGTGEANSSGDSYYGLGILRSADGGTNWTLIQSADGGAHSFKGLAFARMAWSTANPSLVVATTAGSPVAGFTGLGSTGTRGIYYSSDAGVSWKLAATGITASSAPSATGVVYNASAGVSGTFYAAIRGHGLYSSSNGVTWTRLSNQPDHAASGLNLAANCPSSSNSTSCPLYRAELAVVPGRNEMYVWVFWFDQSNPAVEPIEKDGGIWRSTDGGSTWTQIDETGITTCGTGGETGCGISQGSYNLEVAAVPSGSATDLYAGAINLYKCTLASTAAVACTNPGTNPTLWMNLTHVYGCNPLSALAHVHADQHALDFVLSSGKSVLYFANDGGIYRALDGFTGLATGDCTGTNVFDSLNTNLSLTQFVSFSQHPTDFNTVLGGTQDNGSPASASATTSAVWVSVNGGDGGFNEINPNNPSEWFTANTDVSIQRCTSGTISTCLTSTFTPVIGSVDVGGDHGAFYTPYILDPHGTASPPTLILGTCRVWRGPGDGSGQSWGPAASAISFNFESGPGNTDACTGDEANLVRALAAGGPADSSGSKVIYAVTDGTGPVTGAAGGQVFRTTNAAAGSSAWTNVTANGLSNPNHYPLSDVALDPSDATGQTAFVAVQGFATPHVWRTQDAGASWTDFTGNLPDAPANAVVVDNGTVYVGTDTGVFSTSAGMVGAPTWTEVGPSPSGGNTGYLPNVPVTKLRVFSSNGTKLLRAATYGRGLWQFPLAVGNDFAVTVSQSVRTTYPNRPEAFSSTLSSLGSYNSLVNLTCAAGSPRLPSTCLPSPSSLQPTAGGATFSVNVSDTTAGSYDFDVQGVGTDTTSTTHTTRVTLNVVDYIVSAPNPAIVTANVPNSSNSTSFAVTPLGPFADSVVLSCSNLPAGAACNFSPSATLNVVPNTPITVTLTISTSASTPAGTYSNVQFSAQAVAHPAPSSKTSTVTLIVTRTSDFTLTATGGVSTFTKDAGQSATFNGKLTSVNGYSKPTTVSCSGAPASVTCTPPSGSITPSASGTTFQVTLSGATAGVYSFNIQATDGALTHSLPVTLTVVDFSLAALTPSQTVQAGQTATFTLTFTPLGTSSFPNLVTYSCSNIVPANSQITCTFSSTQNGDGTQTVTLSAKTIGATRPQIALPQRNSRQRPLLLAGLSILSLLLVCINRNGRLHNFRAVAAASPALLLLAILAACSVGGSQGINPPPPISVSVSPSTATVAINQQQKFTAVVSNATNTAVTWNLSGSGCSGATCGTIDSTGQYTAPATVPTPATVTVTATSQQDTTKFGNSLVTVQQPTLSVSVSPSTATVPVNQQQKFTAVVSNASNTAVTWNVSGSGCSGATCGTIDSTGQYTAPAAAPIPATVTVTATSQQDTTKFGNSLVTVQQPTQSATYTITVIATDGTLSHTSNVTLTVN